MLNLSTLEPTTRQTIHTYSLEVLSRQIQAKFAPSIKTIEGMVQTGGNQLYKLGMAIDCVGARQGGRILEYTTMFAPPLPRPFTRRPRPLWVVGEVRRMKILISNHDSCRLT